MKMDEHYSVNISSRLYTLAKGEYFFSCFVKNEANKTLTAAVRLDCSEKESVSMPIAPAPEWQKISFKVNVPVTGKLANVIFSARGTGDFLIDNVSLTPLDASYPLRYVDVGMDVNSEDKIFMPKDSKTS
jgi:hypothetical protein